MTLASVKDKPLHGTFGVLDTQLAPLDSSSDVQMIELIIQWANKISKDRFKGPNKSECSNANVQDEYNTLYPVIKPQADKIAEEIQNKYENNLKNAGFFRRLKIKRVMNKEIEEELKKFCQAKLVICSRTKR